MPRVELTPETARDLLEVARRTGTTRREAIKMLTEMFMDSQLRRDLENGVISPQALMAETQANRVQITHRTRATVTHRGPVTRPANVPPRPGSNPAQNAQEVSGSQQDSESGAAGGSGEGCQCEAKTPECCGEVKDAAVGDPGGSQEDDRSSQDSAESPRVLVDASSQASGRTKAQQRRQRRKRARAQAAAARAE